MSRFLLDTHALLFWWSNSPRLGEAARAAIAEPSSSLLVSAASGWEISTKYRIGKLDEIGDPSLHFRRLMQRNGFLEFEVTLDHGLRAGALPGAHRDPFERIIAAQALMEDIPVITRDRAIAQFGCKVLW